LDGSRFGAPQAGQSTCFTNSACAQSDGLPADWTSWSMDSAIVEGALAG